MKLIAIYVASVLLMIIITVAYNQYKWDVKLKNDINCFAQVQYNYDPDSDNTVLNTGILFALENGHGIISYSGRLYHDGKAYTIKRYVEVSYTVKNNYQLLLRTKDLKIASSDDIPDDLASKYLYSYLRDDNGWLNVGIYQNGRNGYVISTTPVPQFLCKHVG